MYKNLLIRYNDIGLSMQMLKSSAIMAVIESYMQGLQDLVNCILNGYGRTHACQRFHSFILCCRYTNIACTLGFIIIIISLVLLFQFEMHLDLG